VPCACIDIGSNTTRLLVAEPGPAGLHALIEERAFTRLGRAGAGGSLPVIAVTLGAEVVAAQARRARAAGAERIRVVGTSAIRQLANGDELIAAIRAASGVDVEVLSGEDEARLAFAGATRALAGAHEAQIAVADVGGGSSEVALGTLAGGVRWSASLPLGSGALCDAHLRSDPPAPDELDAARAEIDAALAALPDLAADVALAVGGSATSLHRLVGPDLAPGALADGLALLCAAPAAEQAERLALHPQRVRLLPAGILILTALSARLGRPLRVGRGGLREGVILEMLSEAEGGSGGEST
jgi:exopolyphosphatase/guanosine-5'-triphosphate,3'-diphosphate pyrophosphatase